MRVGRRSPSSAGRRRAARSACSRSTPPTWAWLDRSVRDAAVSPGAPARGPVAVRLHGRRDARVCPGRRARSRTWTPRGPRSAGRAATRSSPAWRTAPIRWLVEDARAFVRRERRRGRHYDGVVLDPPSYGHGKGAWQIDEHLPAAAGWTSPRSPGPGRRSSLLSAHTQGFDGDRLAALVREHSSCRGHGEALVTRQPRRVATLAARRLGARPERTAEPAECRCAAPTPSRSPARRTRGSGPPPTCATGARATRPGRRSSTALAS